VVRGAVSEDFGSSSSFVLIPSWRPVDDPALWQLLLDSACGTHGPVHFGTDPGDCAQLAVHVCSSRHHHNSQLVKLQLAVTITEACFRSYPWHSIGEYSAVLVFAAGA
jgi:hypothetical protein